MNQIIFPLINLKLNINPVAFTIFGIEIYWYAVIIVCAMITAILLYKKQDGLYGIKFNEILDIVIYTIPISIISARLYYILFNLKYYIENPKSIFAIRNGGLAIYGGLIGGATTIYIITKIKKINILNILDYMVPGIALAQSIGRWGNFVNIEAYGAETKIPWRMGIYEAGKYLEVHPTFLYEAICTFIIFLVLAKMQNKRKYKGQITALYLILYGIARMVIETFRADSLMLGNIRISQMVSIIVIIIGISIILNRNKHNKI